MKSNRVLFVALALGAGPAFAQPSRPSQDLVRPAQSEFSRGVEALQSHDYETAVTALETSYRLHATAVALYNLAIAQRELGHLQLALATFERYLAEGGARIPDARIAAVREAQDHLRAQLATLRLQVTPANAEITVDAHAVAPGTNPITLDPGEHALAISAVGFRTWQQPIRVQAGEAVSRDVALDRDAVTPAPIIVERLLLAPPARARPVASQWWFWASVGVGVAAIVTTSVLVANANATTEPPVPGVSFTASTIRFP